MMSTESESAKIVAQALMATMEIENNLRALASERNHLRFVLEEILEVCERFGSDDEDYEFGTASDVISKIRELSFDGLMKSFKEK